METRIEQTILKNLIQNEQFTRKCIPFLKPEYFTERILSLANNKTENSSRFKCAMEANLQSKSNGRTVQLMLSSGGVRITEASPTEYMDPNRQSSCNTSTPDAEWSLDFDRGTGWK